MQQTLEHGAQEDHRRRRAGLVNDVWPHKRQRMKATGARNTPRLALFRAPSSSPGPKRIPLRCNRISDIESHRPIQTFLHLRSQLSLVRVPPSQRSPPASQARRIKKAIAEYRIATVVAPFNACFQQLYSDSYRTVRSNDHIEVPTAVRAPLRLTCSRGKERLDYLHGTSTMPLRLDCGSSRALFLRQ